MCQGTKLSCPFFFSAGSREIDLLTAPTREQDLVFLEGLIKVLALRLGIFFQLSGALVVGGLFCTIAKTALLWYLFNTNIEPVPAIAQFWFVTLALVEGKPIQTVSHGW